MENRIGSFGKVRNLRIAIVENDSTAAIDIRQKLEHSGYIITGAYCSGKNAANKIHETEPDIIVIDLSSKEGSDGVEIAERIMLGQNIPIVFIAGSADQISSSGISFITDYIFLLKPFTDNELVNAIEAANKSYTKSINFYRDCRRLILEINPYKIDFLNKLDYLINKLSELEGAEGCEKAKYLLNEIRSNIKLYVNTEEPAYLTDESFRRPVSQIIEYADYLLGKIDSMDNEEIKSLVSRICIYLKVLFDFNHSGDLSI